ncbi:btk-binding protein-related [Anaeramoeba flamelloides]|uniref:Btk-binding protein-related n=1 Tax=Anaeramoeba flamelloides TaxID=1746091 RepID=A0ABQ8XV58_9EUKA|nr:btk-binding protein-related [Anaeramoeba flamelloides]
MTTKNKVFFLTVNSTSPVEITHKFTHSVVDISSGEHFAIFILENGQAYEAQKNYGTTMELNLLKIENCRNTGVGFSHYLITTYNNEVYGRLMPSWQYGQIPSKELATSQPMIVPFFEDLKKKTGNCIKRCYGAVYSSFYLTENGDLYASGYNSGGELCTKDWRQKVEKPLLVSHNVKKVYAENYAWRIFFQTKDGKVFTKNTSSGMGLIEVTSNPQLKNYRIKEITSGCSQAYIYAVSKTSDEKKLFRFDPNVRNPFTEVSYEFLKSPILKMSAGCSKFLYSLEQNEVYLDTIKIALPKIREGMFWDVAFSSNTSFVYENEPRHDSTLKLDLISIYQEQKFVETDFLGGMKVNRIWVEKRLRKTIEEICELIKDWEKDRINNLLMWAYSGEYKYIADLREYQQLIGNNELEKTKLKDDWSSLWYDEDGKNFNILVKDDDEEDQEQEFDDDEEEECVEIPVHKFILCVKSGLFRDLFRNTNENQQNVKDFSRKTPESLEIFIKFLYTETFELTADDDPQLTVEELEDAAEYYQLTNNKNLVRQLNLIKEQFKIK